MALLLSLTFTFSGVLLFLVSSNVLVGAQAHVFNPALEQIIDYVWGTPQKTWMETVSPHLTNFFARVSVILRVGPETGWVEMILKGIIGILFLGISSYFFRAVWEVLQLLLTLQLAVMIIGVAIFVVGCICTVLCWVLWTFLLKRIYSLTALYIFGGLCILVLLSHLLRMMGFGLEEEKKLQEQFDKKRE